MHSNLRVDSLQVMFGVPFGPEIDIWSLGCILAEVRLNFNFQQVSQISASGPNLTYWLD